jgi:hypothetical protein
MPDNPNTVFKSGIQIDSIDEEAELELATLKTRNNFEAYFTDDVTRIRAITYSDSPETLIHLLDNVGTADLQLEVVLATTQSTTAKSLEAKSS